MGVITWKMEKGMDRWEAPTEYTHPAEDHSKWGASQVEAGHLYEAGRPHSPHR